MGTSLNKYLAIYDMETDDPDWVIENMFAMRDTPAMPITSPVRTFAPVSGGLFVGSDDETVFLKGSDPKDFSVEVVANYGTVACTETVVPPHMFGKGETRGQSPAAVWMSKQGLCAGLDGGQFMNLTGDRYKLPEGVSHGVSLLKVRGGTPQVVTSLFS